MNCPQAEHYPTPRNLQEVDPQVRAKVDYDPREYAGRPLRRLLFLNHGFAGHHMAVVCGRKERRGLRWAIMKEFWPK